MVSMLRSLRAILTPLTTARTLISGFCSQPQFGGACSKNARMGYKTALIKSTVLFLQRADCFASVVGQDDVGPSAFDARECFHHDALFVDPAFLCGRLD